MADIEESVYLNAARAECLIQFSYDPNFYSSDEARQRAINADTAIRARDPFLRAAVESVWEARGGMTDAAAIQRVRALAAEFQSERPSKLANVQFVASAILAALDAQRPAEGGPEPTMADLIAGRAVLVVGERSTTPPPSPSEPPDETYVIVRSIKARRPLVSLYRLSSGIWQRDGNGAVATWDELVEWDEMHCPVPVGPLPEQVLGCDDDPPSPEGEGARTGVELIAVERRRQIEDEGLVPEHDAEHDRDQLARAAVCYAAPPERRSMRWHNVSAVGGKMPDRGDRHVHAPADWPWHPDSWKPGDRIRELVKAGALIAAEIDRLAALDGGQPDTPAPLMRSVFPKSVGRDTVALEDIDEPDTPAPPAEPATDRATGRPCTVYVPPEYCSDPYRCRVHRGAYPAPAPTQRGLADRPNRWGCYDPQCEDSTWDHDCPVVPVGGEGRTDAE